MKEFYIGIVLFVIIAGMLYLFEPDYIKKPDINHENKIQYDKLILLSVIISLVLTVIICMTMSYDSKNIKKKSVTIEDVVKLSKDNSVDTDIPKTTDLSPKDKFKTYESNKTSINPNIAFNYDNYI